MNTLPEEILRIIYKKVYDSCLEEFNFTKLIEGRCYIINKNASYHDKLFYEDVKFRCVKNDLYENLYIFIQEDWYHSINNHPFHNDYYYDLEQSTFSAERKNELELHPTDKSILYINYRLWYSIDLSLSMSFIYDEDTGNNDGFEYYFIPPLGISD